MQSKFQSVTWHRFKHFQNTIFFSLVAFLSQHLNYSTIIIWIVFNYINSKKNPIVVNLLNINLRRFWNKVVFVPSWLWTCIAHPIYLLEKNKMNPIVKRGKILIPFIILGVRPTSILGPWRDQLVDLIRDENHCMTLKERRLSWHLTILKTMMLERLPLMCLISLCNINPLFIPLKISHIWFNLQIKGYLLFWKCNTNASL
jgi:hypothetical protein